ncbi:hypothetical protein H8E07_13415 [bacterium]|nr:hypothetical protein [bacterium]
MNANTETTKRQILKALKDNGITERVATVNGRGRDWEIETRTENGKRRVCRAITGLGGYRAGFGGWCLSVSYQGHTGDYCDRSSSHHY